jgi:hypothetical protein
MHHADEQHGREHAGEDPTAVPEALGDAERRHLPLVVPPGMQS